MAREANEVTRRKKVEVKVEVEEKEKKLEATESTPMNSGGFFGMWADRGEMSDSSYWVRELRTGEWEKRHV
jgi:hypothetical protein